MTFLGSSNHFSLGSKWFWYLQNDKMYTLGPTESPNGVRKGPEGPIMAPKTLLGPFGPILAYFGGGEARNFSPFGPKKAKIFPQKILFALFCLPKALGPSKPQNCPFVTPMDPIWAHFVGILGQFGVKKTRFSQKKCLKIISFLGRRWSGTLKNRKLPLYTPRWSPNDIYWVPRWCGTLKKPKTGLDRKAHV